MKHPKYKKKNLLVISKYRSRALQFLEERYLGCFLLKERLYIFVQLFQNPKQTHHNLLLFQVQQHQRHFHPNQVPLTFYIALNQSFSTISILKLQLQKWPTRFR